MENWAREATSNGENVTFSFSSRKEGTKKCLSRVKSVERLQRWIRRNITSVFNSLDLAISSSSQEGGGTSCIRKMFRRQRITKKTVGAGIFNS